jgi:hypothetical protein
VALETVSRKLRVFRLSQAVFFSTVGGMHHFAEPAGPDGPGVPLEALERWTREALALTGDAVVLVNDRGCTDPGCPIWEASISVLEPGRTRMWRLVHPRGVFTKIMVRQTVLAAPATES